MSHEKGVMVAPHSQRIFGKGSRRLAIRLGRVHGSKAQSQRQREHRTRAARLCLRVRCACRGGARGCWTGRASCVPLAESVAPGLAGEPAQQTGQETEGQGAETAQTLEPKAFSDYSWDELCPDFRQLTATAATDDEGLGDCTRVQPGRCRRGARRTRRVRWFSMTAPGAYARIAVGLPGTTRSVLDGSGVAGMTLMVSMLSEQPMETSNTNQGGWESSSLRAWLASDGMALLPDDLATHIGERFQGHQQRGGYLRMSRVSVTQTADGLWAFYEPSGSAATSRGLRMSLLQTFPEHCWPGRCAQRRRGRSTRTSRQLA